MKTKKHVLYSLGLIGVAIAIVMAVGLGDGGAVEQSSAVVSPALSVIAQDNGMALAGLVGNSISIDARDFARALNLSSVSSITVTEAPPVSDGELRVGTTVVNSGQTISAASLSLMSYTASGSSTKTTFRFRVNNSAYDIPCELFLLNELNYAPTLDSVPEAYLEVSTHRNITYFGSLPCHDPDGDQTVIEIVSYPRAGLLELTDRESGEYTYSPEAGYSGRDSFTYVARDKYGNYSASATVTLTVKRPTSTVSLVDMSRSPYHNAALSMIEEGIMSGTQVGTATYFYPDVQVSRGEFVVMAMHALGINEARPVSSTLFADDGDIPTEMKPYIAAAYELGYINGRTTDKGLCFEASKSITRAEAAVIIGNMTDIALPTVLPTFKDGADVPAWAAPSLYSLSSAGILFSDGGRVDALANVTRADAAYMLSQLISYLE